MKNSSIICKGFGTWHGYKHGRHWFACENCRWNPTVKSPLLLKGKKYIPLDAETEANHKAFREKMIRELTC